MNTSWSSRNDNRNYSSYSNNNNLGRQPEPSALEIAAEQVIFFPQEIKRYFYHFSLNKL